MKINALRAFVTAVEEGSLRAAARELRVSQPAITKMIRELEVELSATLLTRTITCVVPTAQGKVLHARALNVAKELNAAVDEIDRLGGRLLGDRQPASEFRGGVRSPIDSPQRELIASADARVSALGQFSPHVIGHRVEAVEQQPGQLDA